MSTGNYNDDRIDASMDAANQTIANANAAIDA